MNYTTLSEFSYQSACAITNLENSKKIEENSNYIESEFKDFLKILSNGIIALNIPHSELEDYSKDSLKSYKIPDIYQKGKDQSYGNENHFDLMSVKIASFCNEIDPPHIQSDEDELFYVQASKHRKSLLKTRNYLIRLSKSLIIYLYENDSEYKKLRNEELDYIKSCEKNLNSVSSPLVITATEGEILREYSSSMPKRKQLFKFPENSKSPKEQAHFITGEANNLSVIITFSSFIVSDSEYGNLIVLDSKENEYLEEHKIGNSINKVTMSLWHKSTIGDKAHKKIKEISLKSKETENPKEIEMMMNNLNNRLGDSVEKVLLIKTMINKLNDIT